jgi:hypothetical protein
LKPNRASWSEAVGSSSLSISTRLSFLYWCK